MMKADHFYRTVPGRIFFNVLQKLGCFRLAAWFLHTRLSRRMIPHYIRKYGIDMKPYTGQTYESFAAFFSRKRDNICYVSDPNVLISPCDGLLSVYAVTEDLTLSMKGSVYALNDLLPDPDAAALFQNGLCLVFRLEASDYHHFCCFDDCRLIETNYIPGQLHSVQPIAQRTVPVFRLNRRWWSTMRTKHFGTVVQTEVGAMLVGGVSFSETGIWFKRGDEMGHFELAGSTIILFLTSSVRQRLRFRESIMPYINSGKETRVQIGAGIGVLKDEVCL